MRVVSRCLLLLAAVLAGLLFEGSALAGPAPSDPVSSSGGPGGLRPGLGAEVVDERTARSKTFRRGDGRTVTRVFPGPVHFRDGDAWRAIDNTLVDAGRAGYVHRKANGDDALIPRSLAAPLELVNGAHRLSYRLVEATATATVAGDEAQFSEVWPGVDAAYRAINTGVKKELTLAGPQARSSFSYVLKVSDGLHAVRRADGAVVFADERDRPVFVVGAVVAWDAAGRPSVSHGSKVSLTRDGDGWKLSVALDQRWLRDPARQFPVTVDPDLQFIDGGWTRFHGAQRDCTVASGSSAATNFCADPTLKVGSDGTQTYKSLLFFDVRASIPRDALVLDAELLAYSPNAPSLAVSATRARRVTADWTTAATWNTRDGSAAWATGGGDVSGAANDVSAAVNVGGANGNWFGWLIPTDLVQRWVWGATAEQGLQVAAEPGSPTALYSFVSTEGDSAKWPAIDIAWDEPQGTSGPFTQDSLALSNGSQLSVNVANGALTYRASDVTLPGTAGMNLTMTRQWNSKSAGDAWRSEYGKGWYGGLGNTWIDKAKDDSVYVMDEAGTPYRFAPNGSGGYISPPAINASLCVIQDIANSPCSRDGASSAHYKLTYHRSGNRLYFETGGPAVMAKDRNNNAITASWNSDPYTISGTQGRQVTLDVGASGFVDSLTDGTRTANFTRNTDDRLTAVQDFDGKTTGYEYNGAGYLTKITDPLGHQTRIEWEQPDWYSPGNLASWRPTKIIRVLDTADPSNPAKNPTTTYRYDFANRTTVVTDPAGNATATPTTDGQTTYSYDKQLRVTQVTNAIGEKVDTTYTPNGDVATLGDGTGTLNPRLSTRTYASSGSDPTYNLTGGFAQGTGHNEDEFWVRYCGDSGETACSASDVLDRYRPRRVTGPDKGQAERYGYDSSGNLTDVKDGEDSGSPAIQNRATLGYDPVSPDTAPRDGTLRSATDGNGNKTVFGYNAKRELTSITPPAAGTGGVVGAQLGATTMTYDSLGRLKTLKDGKGQSSGLTHTFSYDPLDRMTKDQLSDGKYISYGYDAAGNLTERKEYNGSIVKTSTYTYDALNRAKTESFPGGQANAYAWTLNSQLASISEPGGTTSYGYDAIDRVTAITEPGNSTPTVTYAYANGDPNAPLVKRNITMTFPGNYQRRVDFDLAMRIAGISAQGAGSGSFGLAYHYDFNDGQADRSGEQVQVRESLDGSYQAYEYDQTGHLKHVQGFDVNDTLVDDWVWSFDKASNRTGLTYQHPGSPTVAKTFKHNADNQLCWMATGAPAGPCSPAPSAATGFSYDANGNQLSGDHSFAYDGFDRTTSMDATGLGYLSPSQNELTAFGAKTMQYNALGLAAETTGSTTVRYIRDPDGNPVAQRRYTNNTLQGTDYLLADRLGSTTGLVNGGQLVRTYTYDPDGNATTTAITPNAPTTNLKYAGGQDLGNGLYHYGARYYNPSLGRWTQQDPLNQLADLQQANRYAYVGSDAVNNSDLIGLGFNPLDPIDTVTKYAEHRVSKAGKLIFNDGKRASREFWKKTAAIGKGGAVLSTLAQAGRCVANKAGYSSDANDCDPVGSSLGGEPAY